MTRGLAAILIAPLISACAVKLPPDSSFSTSTWSAVEALAPGTRVGITYVTGNPPLRHSFEGKLRRAAPDSLVVETASGVQRLDPLRVLRVTVGGRPSRMALVVPLFALAGALVTATYVAMKEDTDEPSGGKQVIGAAAGVGIGALAGKRRGDSRPRAVYVRSGSL